MSDQKSTIQPGDRVRLIGIPDTRTYLVDTIQPAPAEVPQAGPIAFFTKGGGFWRVSDLEKVA